MRPSRRPPSVALFRIGLPVLLACLLHPALRAEEPTDPDSLKPKPPPISELAGRIDQLEDRIRSLGADIDIIARGRLAEVNEAIRKAQRSISDAEEKIDDAVSQVQKRVAAKYNREYSDRKRDRDRELDRLKDRRNEELRRYNEENDPNGTQRRRIREEYDRDSDRISREHRDRVQEIKRRYENELAQEKRKTEEALKDDRERITRSKADLTKLNRESRDLSHKIAGLHKQISDAKADLVNVRRQVADQPEEAWAFGLRPRNGRYVLDADTGELSIIGGLWGRPQDTEEWRRSNLMQAQTLLSLADQMTKADKPDLARKCLRRIIEEFRDTPMAQRARELLGTA